MGVFRGGNRPPASPLQPPPGLTVPQSLLPRVGEGDPVVERLETIASERRISSAAKGPNGAAYDPAYEAGQDEDVRAGGMVDRWRKRIVMAGDKETARPPRPQLFRYRKPAAERQGTKEVVVLCQSPTMRGSLLVVRRGGGEHLHSLRSVDGFWMVLSGKVASCGEGNVLFGELGPCEGIMMPRNDRYWFESVGEGDAEIIQVLHFDRDKGFEREDHEKPKFGRDDIKMTLGDIWFPGNRGVIPDKQGTARRPERVENHRLAVRADPRRRDPFRAVAGRHRRNRMRATGSAEGPRRARFVRARRFAVSLIDAQPNCTPPVRQSPRGPDAQEAGGSWRPGRPGSACREVLLMRTRRRRTVPTVPHDFRRSTGG